jgi:peptide/nickel transport system ATP-binding protein
MNTTEPLLKVENLSIGFETNGKMIPVTDDVSFEIHPQEIYGLVGESGCGKSVTCLAILRLLPLPSSKILSGRILFKGRDLLMLNVNELRSVRGGEIGMIFQEPGSALNPLLTVKQQLRECFRYHPFKGNPEERLRYLLKRVGFSDPDRILQSFPHELSGGMLQRVMISMSLMLTPSLLIADEPTTALDVTIQAQIMELLVELQKEFSTAILMVTHNLNLIAQYADRLSVMYAGRIVEQNNVESFVSRPLHPYSVGLLAALPNLSSEVKELRAIPGQVPRPEHFLTGCRFRDRCPYAFEACERRPDLFPDNSSRVACFLYDKSTAAVYGKDNVSVSKTDYIAAVLPNET